VNRQFKQADKITVYLTPELKTGLEAEKKRVGGTRSAIIRMALKHHLDEQRIKRYEQTIAFQKLKEGKEE
jgi:predicted DNA-binding protein